MKLALILLPALTLYAAKPLMEEGAVWQHKEDGLWPHHVYALTVSSKGTVFAFAEGRIEPGDDAPHHILFKRSTDKGKTWSEDIYIEKSDGKENWANPSAVADPKTGAVFVFYVLNEGGRDQTTSRVYVKSTTDDGLTWTGRAELTSILKTNPKGWPFYMPGPGHGIALRYQKDKSRNGRLVVPFWNRHAVTADQRLYGVMPLISDDHGKTWRLGGVAGTDHGMNESRIAELPDGRLLLNGRGSDPKHNTAKADTRIQRVYAESPDGGDSFQPSFARSNLHHAQVDCSMVAYAAPGKKHALLFSFPSGTAEQIENQKPVPHADPTNLYPISRSRMTVGVSFDEGKTWPHQKLVYEGGAVYSDLVVLPDNSIGLLYGKDRDGDTGWNRAFPQKVVFVRFNYDYLMDGSKK